MKEQRRTLLRGMALLTAPLLGALAITGCSSGSTDNGDAAGGKISLSMTYATSNNLESPFETLANAYMEANPDVTIELKPLPNDTYGDTLRTQLQAGNAPDLIQAEPGNGQTRSVIPLAEAGFLEALDASSAALIPEGNESLFGNDGNTYAQPLVFSYMGLVYNQTAAEAAGVKEFPSDWSGVEAMCTALSGQNKSAFLLAGAMVPNTGMTAMNIAATRVYAENPNWNQDRLDGKTTFAESEGWKDTLQTIIDMREGGCFQAGAEGAGFDVLTNNLSQGLGLGFFAPLGAASELAAANPDSTFLAQAFPPASKSGKPFGIAAPGYSLGVNAKAAHKDAAKAFLAWLAEPAQATLFADISGGLPVSGVDEMDLESTWYAPVADLIRSGSFTALPNSQWASPAVYDALGTGVQGLLTGQSTVDSVLQAMDAAWDQ